MTEKQPRIFLSYSWANAAIADAIDNDFKSAGITFQRDVRDVNYSESIKEFMQSIGKSDFVVMLISDEYIKSENCMYEVTELVNAREFEKRILPVVLSNVEIYGRIGQEKYYDYWNAKLEDAKRLMGKHTHEKTVDDKRKIENIYNYLGPFFQKITDLKAEKYEELKAKNYRPMLDKIGIDEGKVLEQVLKTAEIDDKEEQELAIEDLQNRYPDNKFILFQKAYYAQNNRQFKKAKKYYEELLNKQTKYVKTYNDGSKTHYQYVNKIDAIDAKAYYNLAILLEHCFSDYEGAKIHYEKAIEIDPNYQIAKDNLADLIKNHFSQ